MRIVHLFISPEHNYFGHHGQPAGTAPVIALEEARLVADWGIEGDRFFGWKEGYKGQVTFFSLEVYEALCAEFRVRDRGPGVFRRNVIVSGADLNALIGEEFTVQGPLPRHRGMQSVSLDGRGLSPWRRGFAEKPGRTPGEGIVRRSAAV